MNGSNNLEESDESPLYLCPICLHKLYYCKLKYFCPKGKKTQKKSKLFNGQLNIMKRYERLYEFYSKYGLDQVSSWYRERIYKINSLTH